MTVMHMTKNVGKPYEGKLHVRFDEGELKVKQRPAKESLLEISPLLYIYHPPIVSYFHSNMNRLYRHFIRLKPSLLKELTIDMKKQRQMLSWLSDKPEESDIPLC